MTTGERSGKSPANPGPRWTTECLNHRWQSPALGGRWFADYGEQQHVLSLGEIRRGIELLDDGDKSLIVFDDPADVKGTALLTHSHKEGSDDQWLFLPALKRTKRISSSNKSGPFVGSEFAYEDLSSQEVEKYTYKYLRDEEIDETSYFVMERYPVDKKSGYTRQVVWLDQEHYRVFKVDFYDRKKSKLKTLTSSDFQQYLDKYWRPGRMEMVNHQTGKSTVLTFSDYVFQSGLKDSDFTRNSLSKAR